MSASWKGEKGVSEMKISAERSAAKPKYSAAAAELLAKCREFYGVPENEEAFRAWKAGKEATK